MDLWTEKFTDWMEEKEERLLDLKASCEKNSKDAEILLETSQGLFHAFSAVIDRVEKVER